MELERAAALADERLASFRAEFDVPGIAYGLVKDGELVHAGGVGEVVRGDRVPGPDDVFRIASMTKSFTAAAVLLLRDRGALRLDDPLAAHLPWTEELRPEGGGPPISLRDLLTMNAGLPTDDPWGDRLESLPLEEFDALVTEGVAFTRPPRTGYEYSNLGYALLGRVVAVASGTDYGTFVTRELLAPLGMDSTCLHTGEVPNARRAQGYHPVDSELVPEPATTPGAFSPMGGLHSSVRDLARWVAGFGASWRGEVDHPLSRWSLREMQEPHVHNHTDPVAASGAVPERSVSSGYGFGLVVDDDRRFRRVVSHTGGYPGFGSHMRWHPGTGWGVVVLGNRTYTPAQRVGASLLAELVEQSREQLEASDVAASLWPRTRAAVDVVDSLLESWDDSLADRWFAPNVDLDRPRAQRRAAFEEVRSRIGAFHRAATPWESTSPAHARWWLEGVEGTAYAEVLLSPDRVPRIQSLTVSTEPVPDTTWD